MKVRGVTFEVRAGEIVGIAGVDGNGQTELIEAITGLRSADSRRGQRRRQGHHAARASRDMLDAGLGHIPEDRLRRGLVLEFSLAENLALHDYRERARLATSGWLLPSRLVDRRDGADRRVRRARRGPRRGQRRSPAATSRSSSSRARSRATRGS